MREVRDYLAALKRDNLPIDRVILFGSYAKGAARRGSDIDLLVISPSFKDTDTIDATQYLWRKRLKDDGLTIEPLGMSPERFTEDSSLTREIKETGVSVETVQVGPS
jgi:predicted nucleotidyltransferase